jgi:hypothetical protein
VITNTIIQRLKNTFFDCPGRIIPAYWKFKTAQPPVMQPGPAQWGVGEMDVNWIKFDCRFANQFEK